MLTAREGIHVNDGARDHSFEHAQAVDAAIGGWYPCCGIELIAVPTASVPERPEAGRSRPPPMGVKQSGKATFA
ncbi:MAG: hypothetical protein EBY28_05505 [Betaproteobacteria bacterium]|nr:hypothetical protein [Betaproteobacteria bacterium]